VLSSAFVAGLNLLVAVVVWFANGPDARSSLWTVMTGIGRAAAAFVADPRVTIAIVVFQVVAVAALSRSISCWGLRGSGRNEKADDASGGDGRSEALSSWHRSCGPKRALRSRIEAR
jgi:hypothetical protein